VLIFGKWNGFLVRFSRLMMGFYFASSANLWVTDTSNGTGKVRSRRPANPLLLARPLFLVASWLSNQFERVGKRCAVDPRVCVWCRFKAVSYRPAAADHSSFGLANHSNK
jgi:hypothetical protein